MFPQALATVEHFAALLAEDGVVRGLIGPREAARLWERHLINCALLGEAIDVGADVCDLGSGAGLPGLVLAITRPDLAVTLVEPQLRRTTFLAEVVVRLGLSNVEVVRARAEDLHGTRDFTVVTSRAVAPLPKLLDWSMPLVREGGALVAIKGSSVHRQLRDAEATLRAHGAGRVSVREYGAGLIDPPTTTLRVDAVQPSRLAAGRRRGPGSEGARAEAAMRPPAARKAR